MVDPSVLANHPEHYYRTLMQSSIISKIIYESNPLDSLNTDFGHMNHGIKIRKLIRKTSENSDSDFKYLICDCSINKNKRILIVGFRGTDNNEDILTDLKTYSTVSKWEGRIHAGFYERSENFLKESAIKFFADKIIKENYRVVFTGHSLGAATASLVTVNLLLFLKIKDYCQNVLFIGFGSPLIGCQNFKNFIEPRFCNSFHFYINENDIVPRILSHITKIAHAGVLAKLAECFKSYFKLSSDKKACNEINSNDKPRISMSFISLVKSSTDIVPINYVPFGKLFHLKLVTVGNRPEFIIEDFNNNNFNFDIKNILPTNLINDVQNHSMENYHYKILGNVEHRVKDLNAIANGSVFDKIKRIISKI